MEKMTLNELHKKYKLHHSALTREHNGYVSVRENGVGETDPIPYNGRFGRGYITYANNRTNTYYCFIKYYTIRR